MSDIRIGTVPTVVVVLWMVLVFGVGALFGVAITSLLVR